MAESPGTLMARLLSEAQANAAEQPPAPAKDAGENSHEVNLKALIEFSGQAESSSQAAEAAAKQQQPQPIQSTSTMPASLTGKPPASFGSGLPPGLVLPPTMRLQMQAQAHAQAHAQAVAQAEARPRMLAPRSAAVPSVIASSNSLAPKAVSPSSFTSSLPTTVQPSVPPRPRVITEKRQYLFAKPKVVRIAQIKSPGKNSEDKQSETEAHDNLDGPGPSDPPDAQVEAEANLEPEVQPEPEPEAQPEMEPEPEPEVHKEPDAGMEPLTNAARAILAVEELENLVKQRLEELVRAENQPGPSSADPEPEPGENVLLLSHMQPSAEEVMS